MDGHGEVVVDGNVGRGSTGVGHERRLGVQPPKKRRARFPGSRQRTTVGWPELERVDVDDAAQSLDRLVALVAFVLRLQQPEFPEYLETKSFHLDSLLGSLVYTHY